MSRWYVLLRFLSIVFDWEEKRREASERVLKSVGRSVCLIELWRAKMCWKLLFNCLAFLVCRCKNVLYGCCFPNTQQVNQVHKCKNRKVVKAGTTLSMSPHVSSLRAIRPLDWLWWTVIEFFFKFLFRDRSNYWLQRSFCDILFSQINFFERYSVPSVSHSMKIMCLRAIHEFSRAC